MISITDNILYESRDIVVINKSSGVPVQADHTKDLDLWTATNDHFGQELHLVNRLDRPVSGIVVFALNRESCESLMKKWNSKEVIKEYMAIVEGHWKTEELVLTDKIKKGRNNKAIIHPKGKTAKLKVESFALFDNYTLCRIYLMTGRFHQIRLQLSHAGHPIKGDVKYGARRKNPDRSIHLHAGMIAIGDIKVKAPFPGKDVLWKTAADYYNKYLL